MSNEQDLRFIRTNQLLVSAFTELLSNKKFEDITVNELCEKALVRRATFYTHFLDKYDFFSYFVRQHSENFREKLPAEETEGDFNEFFLQMCRQLLSYLGQHMAMVQNAMNSTAFPILLSILSEQIRVDLTARFKEVGSSEANSTAKKAEVSAEIVAAFYSGGLIKIVHSWISDKNRLPEERLIEEIRLLLKSNPACQL